jgi:hypothetical protein
MRSFDYARTPPEAPEGFSVLVVRLVFVIMARALCWRLGPASTVFGPKIGLNEVEQDGVVTQ